MGGLDKSPEEVAKKWGDRLKSSTPEIRDAITKLTVNPMEEAVKHKDKLLNNLTNAIKSGKWERKIKKVTLDEWKKLMTSKGIPNISTGVDNAQGKMKDFLGQLFEYEKRAKAEVDKIPVVTIEDAVKKAGEWIRKMHDFEYK